MTTPTDLPAYVEINGAAYMLCRNWIGHHIYLLYSHPIGTRHHLCYPAAALPPRHTPITREHADEARTAFLTEGARTHTPHPRPGRHPDQ